MQLIISKEPNYKNKDKVFFSKSELQIILQTYSKQVSSGVCRDYSIDNSKQKAIFSFFRSTFDKPIFQIEKKNNVKSKLLFDFIHFAGTISLIEEISGWSLNILSKSC